MGKFTAVAVAAVALVDCSRPEPVAVTSSSIATGDCPHIVAPAIAATIPEVLRSPASFNLKPVRLVGVYYGAFEQSAVYPTVVTGREPSPSTGIWVSPLPDSLIGKRVQLIGYFTHAVKGHWRQWAGALWVASARVAREDSPWQFVQADAALRRGLTRVLRC